ncbi:MAG: hypothetical protein V2A66_03305 [Pseudomonadota bacterium]
MTRFDRKAFDRFLIDNRVVGFFDKPVTLKSGRQSQWYVNWRTVAGDVFLLDRLSDFLIDFVSDFNLSPDAFYGVPEGASKLGIVTTFKWAKAQKNYAVGSHPMPMGRGRVKEHGSSKDRFFVGEPRGNIVVIEDVTTTGGSLITTLDHLAQVDVHILAAIGLTNRMEKRDDGKSVAEAISERGVQYHSLSDATEFLPEACRAFKPGEKIVSSIEEEFRQYGVKPLKLPV